MFYSLARHFTLTLPLSTRGGGGWEVSYRQQTLRETLVKAGITNPLQWIFRLVGRFSILDGQKVYHISKSALW